MSEPLPTIAEVVEATSGHVLHFRHRSDKYFYQRAAVTSCGCNLITLLAWKSDGSWQTDNSGQKVHCAICGELQSFGPAAPGTAGASHRRATQTLSGMATLSDHDDEPYGGGV